MKLILSTLITFALIFNSENTLKNNSNISDDSESHIAYFEAGENAVFEVGSPFYLDVDKDGNDDFLFQTVTLHEEGKIVTRYMVKGLAQNQVLVADGSAAISEQGETISSNPEFDNLSWSTHHGEILGSSFDGSSVSYNGTWSGDRDQYVGFKLVKENNEYYGYAEVSIDPIAEKARVLDYAINRAAGEQVVVN